MDSPLDSARLLRSARERAGLSQRELARRARTAQSVVARIELGLTKPAAETLERLLDAAGFRLSVSLVPLRKVATHMLDDVARILAMTPEDRLREVANASRFIAAARRA
jgi:transcriptional regulator with XRE-family HTH domain